MATPEVITGDDISLPVTLKINGATFNIPGTATVTAQLVKTDHSGAVTGALAAVQSDAAPGADWPNSLVVIEFAPTDTSGISADDQGKALIEIQVDDGSKRTWFVTVKIVKGNIA
jgi:hypothetical protein